MRSGVFPRRSISRCGRAGGSIVGPPPSRPPTARNDRRRCTRTRPATRARGSVASGMNVACDFYLRRGRAWWPHIFPAWSTANLRGEVDEQHWIVLRWPRTAPAGLASQPTFHAVGCGERHHAEPRAAPRTRANCSGRPPLSWSSLLSSHEDDFPPPWLCGVFFPPAVATPLSLSRYLAYFRSLLQAVLLCPAGLQFSFRSCNPSLSVQLPVPLSFLPPRSVFFVMRFPALLLSPLLLSLLHRSLFLPPFCVADALPSPISFLGVADGTLFLSSVTRHGVIHGVT